MVISSEAFFIDFNNECSFFFLFLRHIWHELKQAILAWRKLSERSLYRCKISVWSDRCSVCSMQGWPFSSVLCPQAVCVQELLGTQVANHIWEFFRSAALLYEVSTVYLKYQRRLESCLSWRCSAQWLHIRTDNMQH